MSFKTTQQQGFALLLTLIVVSVVLSVGLSLLDITLKQLILSGTTRDSEIAFHAAYVGTECAERWVREDYMQFIGSPTGPRSIGVNNAYQLTDCVDTNLNGDFSKLGSDRYRSSYELDWVVGTEGRCTRFDVIIFDAITAGTDMTYGLPNYDGTVTCRDGNVCTYIFSRGYNRACTDTLSLGTVQREVFSKF